MKSVLAGFGWAVLGRVDVDQPGSVGLTLTPPTLGCDLHPAHVCSREADCDCGRGLVLRSGVCPAGCDPHPAHPLGCDLHPAHSLVAGKLTVIVGAVGSGKSSLLAAALGEMCTLGGTVRWRP